MVQTLLRLSAGLCKFAVGLAIALLAACGSASASGGKDGPVPAWYSHGILAALLDPENGVPAAALVMPRAIDALVSVTRRDPNVRDAVSDALLAHLRDPDVDVERAAAKALGQIELGGPKERDAVTEALLTALLTARLDDGLAVAVITALGHIKQNNPVAYNAIIKTLRPRLHDPDPRVRQAAAAAIIQITQEASEGAHEAVTKALLARLGDADHYVQAAAATALGQIMQVGPEERKSVVEALLARLRDTHDDVQAAAATALGQIEQTAPKGHEVAIKPLLARIQRANFDVQAAAAQALGLIAQVEPNERDAVTKAFLLIIARNGLYSADVNPKLTEVAVRELGRIEQVDARTRRQVTEVLLDYIEDGASCVGAAAAKAVVEFTKHDPTVRDTVTESLLRKLGDSTLYFPTDPAAFAATALGQITQDSPTARRAVEDALLHSLNLGNDRVQAAAARSLARIARDDPSVRSKVVTALLSKVPWADDTAFVTALGKVGQYDRTSRAEVIKALLNVLFHEESFGNTEAAITALIGIEPIRAATLLMMLKKRAESASARKPVWQARAIALSGIPAKASRKWAYLTFLRTPGTAGIPWPGSTQRRSVAMPAIRAISSAWGRIRGTPGLAIDASTAVVELVRHACPEASALNSKSWLATGRWLLRSEFIATGIVLERSIGFNTAASQAGLCWTSGEHDVLVKLRAAFTKDPAAVVQASQLAQELKSERPPLLWGRVTTAILGWAGFWLGLILAFPFSARVRSAYLYNEKLHGLLALWFVPLLLILLPVLRKLLLRPFRDRLLADAHPVNSDYAAWYPNVLVSDSRGTTCSIMEALPRVRGNILLIGESGCGKTAFSRVLASKSRKTVAFLNARDCDKGVIEAIRRRASEVQGDGFFKSLIETRDLTVIVDALNEVNADVRGLIVAFVNDFPNADILVATQPIDTINTSVSPFKGARLIKILPLANKDIENFLLSRPIGQTPGRQVAADAYDAAVKTFLYKRLEQAPSEEARAMAYFALSNPANLVYAADLLWCGEMPFPNDLIGQAFALASNRYLESYSREFPRRAFALKAVELRLRDVNYLSVEEFSNEQPPLLQYRLLVMRSMYDVSGKAVQAAVFRHDIVMDYFIYFAFLDDEALQILHVNDARFRGVYLLFAERAPPERARLLRDLLVIRAAETGDHTLSDEYVRRLNARYPQDLGAQGNGPKS